MQAVNQTRSWDFQLLHGFRLVLPATGSRSLRGGRGRAGVGDLGGFNLNLADIGGLPSG